MEQGTPLTESLLSSPRTELEALQARAVGWALTVLVLDALSVSLGLSVLAYFLEDLGGNALALGSLFATFAIFNIASSAWTGYASDKMGRRLILTIATAGVASGFLATALAQSVPWIFAARAWLGFWSGVGSTSRAYIADVTDTAKRTDAMGKAGALMMVGYATGAPLGSMLALLAGGYRTPFLVGAGASALATVLVWVRLPEPSAIQALMRAQAGTRDPPAAAVTATKPAAATATPAAAGGEGGGGGLVPGASPRLVLLCLYLVCTCVAQGFLMVVLPLFLMAAFGWGAPIYAAVLSARAAAAFLQMIALGKVVPRVGGHVALALVASTVGAAGALLSAVAAVGVDKTRESQVHSGGIVALFVVGLVLQYSVTGFATGVAAPAISALGDSSVQGRLMVTALMLERTPPSQHTWPSDTPSRKVPDAPTACTHCIPTAYPLHTALPFRASTAASRWVGAWADRSSSPSSTRSRPYAAAHSQWLRMWSPH